MSFRLDAEGSSFYDLLTSRYPGLLPQLSPHASRERNEILDPGPHGTTILALKSSEGVIIAGDRRATEGFQISSRRIEKVYKTDSRSAIAIAGAAGPCLEMAKLFQTELEHYEKLEGVELSTDGKANKLSQMIKANLPLAMQGLVVIPIFVGYDMRQRAGRIFKYDVTGGRYEETDYHATGSGGKDAKNTLKKVYRKGMGTEESVRIAFEALMDAAEEDVGTGGADPIHGIFPTIKIVNEAGISDVPIENLKEIFNTLIESRKEG